MTMESSGNGALTPDDHDRVVRLERDMSDLKDSHEGLKERVGNGETTLHQIQIMMAEQFAKLHGKFDAAERSRQDEKLLRDEQRNKNQWWIMAAISIAGLLVGLSGWAAFIYQAVTKHGP